MDSPKLQRWDNDELRLCLSKGYLSRKHPKLSCAFSGTISLLAQGNSSWLFSAIDFFLWVWAAPMKRPAKVGKP